MEKVTTTIRLNKDIRDKSKQFGLNISKEFENYLILKFQNKTNEEIIDIQNNIDIKNKKSKYIEDKYNYLKTPSKITKEMKNEIFQCEDYYSKVLKQKHIEQLEDWMNEFQKELDINIRLKYLKLIENMKTDNNEGIYDFLKYRYNLSKTLIWIGNQLGISKDIKKIIDANPNLYRQSMEFQE